MARLGQPNNPAGSPSAMGGRPPNQDNQALRSLPNAKYGEQQAYQQQQQGAAVGASPGGEVAAPPASQGPPLVPFGAPTNEPGTPVTDGADAGAGAGLAALGINNQDALAQSDDLRAMAEVLPVLEYYANKPYASPGIRQLVKRIKGQMP